MLTFEKGIKRKYCYGGSGILDSIISAVTSNTMKNVATEVGKKAMTEVGNKVIDKVMKKADRSKLDKYLDNPKKVLTLEEIIKKMNST
jgi:hypothetical protein